MCDKKGKIVLLLGAGFAIPYGGPTSAFIRDAFCSDDVYGEIAKKIFVELDDFYDNELVAKSSFESFMSLLENYMLFEYAKRMECKDEQHTSLFALLFDVSANIKKISLEKYADGREMTEFLGEIYLHFLNILISKIAEYDGAETLISNSKFTQELVSSYSYLRQTYSQIKIYTTNYDRLIPLILTNENINESIDKDGFYNYDFEQFREDKLTFFNLHGSIHTENKYRGKYKPYVNFYPKPSIWFSPSSGGNPGDFSFWLPIITGYNKLQRTNVEPFNFGFNVFSEDISSCNTFCTIGYSFFDTHINSIISQYLKESVKVISVFSCSHFTNSQEEFRLKELFKEYKDYNEEGDWAKRDNHIVYIKGIEQFVQEYKINL